MDVHQDLAEFGRRVERLRRSNTRLAIAVVVGPIVAVVVATAWSSGPRLVAAEPQAKAKGIIEARGLVIRDETGKLRATLGYEGERDASLKLYDAGVLRSEYRVWLNGMPSLGFLYPDGTDALSIAGGGDGSPSVDVFDRKGDARVQLSLSDAGPNLSLHHTKIRTRFQLGILSSGVPYMDFFDQKDRVLPMLDKAGIPLRSKP
jgi:hypothetical protein